MQTSDELATLPVGTEVSAKYKGAFCEAKVKKVGRQVKCKVTFKLNLGSFTLCESSLNYTGPLVSGCQLEARHPEKGSVHEAIVTKIYDQSQYTVVFDDGDIATLKRNSLHMKSGKHFNASESLDNLPLTHPEHFGTPVGGRRKRMDDDDEEEEEDSSDDEADTVPYITKLGSVVMVEMADKKTTKVKENWFPGLIVSPHAQDQRKINTKEDFLIRSFRDHRYFTVPRKECKKFHKDSGKKVTETSLLTAIELANVYLANNERLPDHWDREILFAMGGDSSTEGSSEDEEAGQLSDGDDAQSPEEKDHLVAELYKHMDDRGTPINRTPYIDHKEVDLYMLFRLVQKLGGNQRVTNNNQWRMVAKRLGFETNWCVNQVRVHYKRYLQSFEELYKTLGCTLITHPRGTNLRVRHGSGRPLVRGVRVGSKAKDEEGGGASDRSSISSQEGGEGPSGIKKEIKEELLEDEFDLEVKSQISDSEKKAVKKENSFKEEPLDEETEVYDRTEKVKDSKKKNKDDIRMTTRPRRDSTSSLSAAVELKAKKEDIGDPTKKDVKKKSDKSRDDDDSGSTCSSGTGKKLKKDAKKKDDYRDDEFQDDEGTNSDLDAGFKKKKTPLKSKMKGSKPVEGGSQPAPGAAEGEEQQHLEPHVECAVSDKIKVFWRHGQIYEAKIMKAGKDKKEGKFYVHYQGWNQRYDEWITRGKIAENITWNENPRSHKAREAKAEKQKKKPEKVERSEKAKSEEEDEKQDTDEKNTSEEEKEEPDKKEGEYKKKMLKKAKSVTPTSTPSSSRTSSPASLKRTKSPAPKSQKAMSPSVKEKTPVREKKKEAVMVKRTASPLPAQKSPLKRQSSRTSVYKAKEEEEEMEAEAEASDSEAQEEKTPRRSNRGEKEKGDSEEKEKGEPEKKEKGEPEKKEKSEPEKKDKVESEKKEKADSEKKEKAESEKKPKATPRSSSTTRTVDKKKKAEAEVEAETEDENEGKKIADSVISQKCNVRLGKLSPIKKPSTKTVDSSDPYVFQEPDESPSKFETPTKSILERVDSEVKRSPGRPPKSAKREEPEKAAAKEVDPIENIPDVPGEVLKILTPVNSEENSGEDAETSKPEASAPSAKDEDKDKKPFLQMTDQYASLFPHLASLSRLPQTTESPSSSPRHPGGDSPKSAPSISSASFIHNIVESTIIKTSSDPDEKSEQKAVTVEENKADDKVNDDEKSSKDASTPSKKGKNKKPKKRSMRTNPTHKSREVVTDSDTDSESEEATKISKPVTPSRRKTTDKERPTVTPIKRLKQEDSDDETSPKKRLKKRREDDTSLMCEETIPRSPQPHASEGLSTAATEECNSPRLEMPFATVPHSASQPGGVAPVAPVADAAPVQQPMEHSPPATPDSSNSGEAPLTIDSSRIKEDGSKSTAESSEVDMESLSGQGKAGSEDSRLDIEFSSSSENRRTSRGARRRQTLAKKEPEEVVKSPETVKRKRKAKPETPSRGRGKGRGRHGSGVGRGVGRQADDDDAMDTSSREVDRLERLDNAALAALAHPKPNSTSKYNGHFFVHLDPGMEPTERISKLQGTLENLRKTYLNIKGNLSAIERRRKKIRRKERDRSQMATEVAA